MFEKYTREFDENALLLAKKRKYSLEFKPN
jgi:hypothetical protein